MPAIFSWIGAWQYDNNEEEGSSRPHSLTTAVTKKVPMAEKAKPEIGI
jgi:hypothetical protein